MRSIVFLGQGLGLLSVDDDMGCFWIFVITPRVPPSTFRYNYTRYNTVIFHFKARFNY